MKYGLIFFLLFFYVHIFGFLNKRIDPPKETRQIIVHFSQTPASQAHHDDWNAIIEESLQYVNKSLIHDGWISSTLRDRSGDTSWWEKVKYWLLTAYYSLTYPTTTKKYPRKENKVFFTRIVQNFGLYAIHVPDGVPSHIVEQYLKKFYAKKGVRFHLDKDAAVHIAYKPDVGLEGQYLTAQELVQLKQKTLISEKQEQLGNVEKKTLLSAQDQRTAQELRSSIETLSRMRDALFWYQSFPTTGLVLQEPFYPPNYPYLPHYFSLWQLAPHKGDGVTIAVLDTGVAAYQLKDDPSYRKNKDLDVKLRLGTHNFNIVSDNGLDPIEQLMLLFKSYTDEKKFVAEEVENQLPSMIKAYLINKDDTLIRKYLQEKGKTELIKNNSLTEAGEKALKEITVGRHGIAPQESGITKPFTIKQLQEPYQQDVIVELLPAARIGEDHTTFVAGHGSHTFGLIAGQGTLDGMVGLAPSANTFMIKSFKDNGLSDKSTLIAGLEKAIIHRADIVNLSLKIADNLDLTEKSSALLERICNLVPYLVAASGNNGDPRSSRYAGEVESYPARFDAVPFDVGAFAYKDGKASIAPFSQYEPGVGPLFVAPGFDIISTGLVPRQQEDSVYVFMAGTSMATPIVTGFVALMLGEFKEKFSRDQLLKVCYRSAFKMYDNDEWKKKVVLGVLDMRTALFILHALDRLREALKEKKSSFDVNAQFDHALQAIIHILDAQPKQLSDTHFGGVSFKHDFMTYFDKAHKNKDAFKKEDYFIPEGPYALENALLFVTNSVLAALDATFTADPKASPNIIKEVAEILKKKEINLFADVPEKVQKRITAKEKVDPYWQKKADALRKQMDIEKAIE
jgi:subtilisin family serine protease